MFSKIALFVTSAFVLAAVAAPGGPANVGDQCNVGQINCCNSVQESSNTGIQSLLGLLGVALGSVTGQVGLVCDPISVIGVGGNSCSAQPVCCTGNNFNGVVALGCTPINLNL
ncbi:fungal hydrophobin [Macrolepiota fuliginosa MF-IS2]|uniref:Hydrophobin n=1 Tax=Macrolepiota fuliginosa MF-IS2 TaxID=1400762 RepID=A0A9P5XJ93_9AGAR|nr:fungal hydrophobin [Macrolepiota fuliginosa MF-IS2]